MSPEARKPEPLKLVIFDCDGVLVDSEGPSNRIVAEEITRLGWPMGEAESTLLFVGYRLSDIPPVVERHLGRPVPENWVEHLRTRLIESFAAIETIEGAHQALAATTALGLPFRIASNSSHEEMDAKFATTGLDALILRRQHSARDVPRGKPAPDVFLAAAAAEGVPPASCVVVEDSIPGITAARAAGMAVIALCPHADPAPLLALGATPIRTLAELPALLQTLLHTRPQSGPQSGPQSRPQTATGPAA